MQNVPYLIRGARVNEFGALLSVHGPHRDYWTTL